MHARGGWMSAAALMLGTFVAGPATAQTRPGGFTNLQVLPDTISRSALIAVMLDNLRGLGLRQRQSQGCLHCHVGDMERPVEEWDFAADDKPAKGKARVMMAMVQAINTQHLGSLETRGTPPVRVNCATCHAGRIDPRPLRDVLRQAYTLGGVDSMTARYRRLYTDYFGSAAYDFRVGVLGGLALDLAADGAWGDAEAVARLEIETFPEEPGARRTLVTLTLRQTLSNAGVDSMLTMFARLRSGPDGSVITPGVLDAIAWMLFRQDRREAAVSVMGTNRAAFPDQYVPAESLAFAALEDGDEQAAIRMFEDWLARHPGHDHARWQLINLRTGR